MKKLLLLLLCLAPLLAGLPRVYAQRRELEHLRLVETMGLDASPEGLRLSLAAPGGKDRENLCVSASGASVAAATEALRGKAGAEELFCGHLQHILLGEDYARRSLDSLFDAVCRSSDLRLDMPVWLVLGDSAQGLMEALQETEGGVSGAVSRLDRRSGGGSASLSSAGRILRDLERQGCALILALRAEEGSLQPAGCGVLGETGLLAVLSPEEALTAELLLDALQPAPLLLEDGQGRRVTLELQEAQTRVEPLWDQEGRLSELEILVTVQAAVLEIDGGASPTTGGALAAQSGVLAASAGVAPPKNGVALAASTGVVPPQNGGALAAPSIILLPHGGVVPSNGGVVPSNGGILAAQSGVLAADPPFFNATAARMEAEIIRRIAAVLELSRSLQADFLGLGRRIEALSPRLGRGLSRDLGSLLPALPIRISVRAELRHSSDLN